MQVFATNFLHHFVEARLEDWELVGVPRGYARLVLVGHKELDVGVVPRHDGHRRAAYVTGAEANDLAGRRHGVQAKTRHVR